MRNALVSIIMPAYNAQRYIGHAIESVLLQSCERFELIIIDDCSTDETSRIVQAYGDRRIRFLQHIENQGPAGARNTGIEACSRDSKWLTFIDADDQWAANRLETLLAAVSGDHEGVFVADDKLFCIETKAGLKGYGRYDLLRKSRRLNWKNNVLDANFADFLRLGAPVLQPLIPMHHMVTHRLRYDSTIRYGEDLELYFRLFKTGLRLRLVNEPLYLYRDRAGSITRPIGDQTSWRGDLFRVYDRMLGCSDLGEVEKSLLKDLLAHKFLVQALRRYRWGDFLQTAVANPRAFLKLCYNGPRSIWNRRRDKRLKDRLISGEDDAHLSLPRT